MVRAMLVMKPTLSDRVVFFLRIFLYYSNATGVFTISILITIASVSLSPSLSKLLTLHPRGDVAEWFRHWMVPASNPPHNGYLDFLLVATS